MTFKQQRQLAFFHHSLWCYAKTLSQDDAILIARISEFRNSLDEPLKGLGEDSYSNGLAKAGIEILNITVQ